MALNLPTMTLNLPTMALNLPTMTPELAREILGITPEARSPAAEPEQLELPLHRSLYEQLLEVPIDNTAQVPVEMLSSDGKLADYLLRVDADAITEAEFAALVAVIWPIRKRLAERNDLVSSFLNAITGE